MSDLSDILRGVSRAATAAAPLLPGPAATVAGIAAAALGLAADFAAAGADPVTEIKRIRSEDPMLANVEEHWARRLRDEFPPPSSDGFYDENDDENE